MKKILFLFCLVISMLIVSCSSKEIENLQYNIIYASAQSYYDGGYNPTEKKTGTFSCVAFSKDGYFYIERHTFDESTKKIEIKKEDCSKITINSNIIYSHNIYFQIEDGYLLRFDEYSNGSGPILYWASHVKAVFI